MQILVSPSSFGLVISLIQILVTIPWPFNVILLIQLHDLCQLVNHVRMKYYCTNSNSTAHWHSKPSVLDQFSINTVLQRPMLMLATIIIKIKTTVEHRAGLTESMASVRRTATTRCQILWLSSVKSRNKGRIKTTGIAQSLSNIHNTIRCFLRLRFHQWLDLSPSSAPAIFQWWIPRQLPSVRLQQCHRPTKSIKILIWIRMMSINHRH